MKMSQVTMFHIVAGEATQLIMILINEEACPWKATWRDAMQGRLYLEGWHSTNVTLGRFLPSMSCVVKLPNNCGLSELYLKYYE